ncbi:MAG: hypothetical protein V4727_09665 [Verrucomicrobiota bacterium]
MQDSSQLVLEGITHLENGSWESALHFFDQAIAIREASDWKSHPLAAWGLAAAYINRSDALRRIDKLPEAILSLDKAILSMDHVQLSNHPSYPDRLILAWINLATAQEELSQPTLSAAAFAKAEDLLTTWGSETTPNRTFLAAMFHTNRARFFIGKGESLAAWTDAATAVRLLNSLGCLQKIAPAAIRARGVLCQALALILEIPNAEKFEADWIARATDAAEEALELARTTNYQGEWLPSLVLYCARIYRICQPHFLGEFLHDTFPQDSHLAKQPVLLQEMINELAFARSQLVGRVIANSQDTKFVIQETATLHKLQLAETHLLTHPALLQRASSGLSLNSFNQSQ